MGWFDIEGSVGVTVDEETFTNEFLAWMQSNGWTFLGVIQPAKHTK
jgi:hypothetical protein